MTRERIVNAKKVRNGPTHSGIQKRTRLLSIIFSNAVVRHELSEYCRFLLFSCFGTISVILCCLNPFVPN